jgi:hypothetical protein
MPIQLVHSGVSCQVELEHVVTLGQAYVNDQLTELEFEYIANAIDISPDAKFFAPGLREVVGAFAESSDDRPVTKEEVLELLASVSHGATA